MMHNYLARKNLRIYMHVRCLYLSFLFKNINAYRKRNNNLPYTYVLGLTLKNTL